jgi:O-antigen ligase
MIVWAFLGLEVTNDAGRTLEALIDLSKLWIIAFCVVNVVRTAADFRFLVIVWLAVFALYPVRGALYNQYICHCTTLGRVTWNFVFGNPNDLAALTMIPLGLSAGVATVERAKFFRMSALAGVVILSMIILLTQSRAAILGLGAAALLLLLSSRRKARDIITLVVLLGAAIVFAPKKVWERVAGLANVSVEADMQGVDPEASAESRWAIWQVAFRAIRENPVTGIGANMMPVRHSQEASRLNLRATVRGEKDTHSTYIRMAAEMGVPALILYLTMWGSTFRKVHRVRRSIAHVRPKDHQVLFFLELAMCAFMVASLFGSYERLSFTYLIVCVAWLAAEILERSTWYVSPQTALKLQAEAARAR